LRAFLGISTLLSILIRIGVPSKPFLASIALIIALYGIIGSSSLGSCTDILVKDPYISINFPELERFLGSFLLSQEAVITSGLSREEASSLAGELVREYERFILSDESNRAVVKWLLFRCRVETIGDMFLTLVIFYGLLLTVYFKMLSDSLQLRSSITRAEYYIGLTLSSIILGLPLLMPILLLTAYDFFHIIGLKGLLLFYVIAFSFSLFISLLLTTVYASTSSYITVLSVTIILFVALLTPGFPLQRFLFRLVEEAKNAMVSGSVNLEPVMAVSGFSVVLWLLSFFYVIRRVRIS